MSVRRILQSQRNFYEGLKRLSTSLCKLLVTGYWLQLRSHGSPLLSPVSRSVSRLGEDPGNEDV